MPQCLCGIALNCANLAVLRAPQLVVLCSGHYQIVQLLTYALQVLCCSAYALTGRL